MGIIERIRVAAQAAFMDASDMGRVNTALAASATPEELIREARRLRLAALTALDTAVILALAEGRSWEQVAAMAGVAPGTAYAQYAPMYGAWLYDTDGGEFDTTARYRAEDPDRALVVSQWLARHAEPWDATARAPLAGG